MFQRGLDYLRQFDRNLWALSFGWFVASLGFAASMPFISIYFHSRFGMSITQIGVIFGVLAVVRCVAQAVGGEVSDRTSRRSMLVQTQVFRAVAFTMLALTIYADSGFWLVATGLLLATIFGAIFQPVANATVSDILPAEKRLDGFAITRSAGNLGWAVGPAIGGFLATASYGLLFLISAGLTFLSGLALWALMSTPPSRPVQDRFRLSDIASIKDDPLLARHSVLIFVLYLVVAQLIVPFSVYTVEMVGLTKTQLGYLFTLNGLLVVALQIPITRFLARSSLTTQLALGAFIYVLGYGIVGSLVSFGWFVVAITIVSIGEMTMSPASLALTSKLAPESRMGRYMGLFSFFTAAGWSFGPLFGGAILDHFSDTPALAWLLISSLALVPGLGYILSAGHFARRLADVT